MNATRPSALAALALSCRSVELAPIDRSAASMGWTRAQLVELEGRVPDTAVTPFRVMRGARVAWIRPGQGMPSCLVVAEGQSRRSLHWIVSRRGVQALAQGVLVGESDFDDLLTHWERTTAALSGEVSGEQEAVAGQREPDREQLSFSGIESTDNETIRFVNSTLLDALNAGASDVHIESVVNGLVVKFRLDGVLVLMTRVAGVEATERVISRIKVMAELDIAERRIPQDGRLKLAAGGRDIDVRVSVMPSIHGEDAVLRILDRQALVSRMQALTVEGLGFDADLAARLLPLFKLPYGMVLVTGPTGSGKTTTLYAAISQTRDHREKVITIEDPVEYQLDGVLQIPVNERKGLSFASGLRSILRHDPDRILVGEIRDAETARIAVQAALTGHLVMTTIHANNALDVLSRFKQFAIDPYDVVSALVGVVAQRLVRQLCSHCSTADERADERAVRESLKGCELGAANLRKPMGCVACRNTGYRGRKAIGELVVFDKRLRRELLALPNPAAADEAALGPGLLNLHQRALLAAWGGHTSLEEALRVTMAQ